MSKPTTPRLDMLDWLHDLVTYTPQVTHTFLALKTIKGLQRRERAAMHRRASTMRCSAPIGQVVQQLGRGLE